MKKTSKTLIAATLAIALAVPAVATPESEAAGKAPKLTPNSATIFLGKTKTFTIKNVKKSNVKSLKVKTGERVVMTKKILTNKKVGFVLKATGGGLIEIDVVLKLKKAQAGKKAYKFTLDLQTGSKENPIISLSDKVSENMFTALILKEGTEEDLYSDNLDNAFELDIYNDDKIGARNMMVQWFVDGKEIENLTRDAAGSREYRPETKFSASGSAASGAATGVERHEYYCVVENTFTGEKIESNHKPYKIVSQAYIDRVVAGFDDFRKKYPDPKTVTMNAAYLEDFKTLAFAFGSVLGGSELLFAETVKNINEARNNQQMAAELLANDEDGFQDSFIKVGKYIGVEESSVKAYYRYLDDILMKYLTDPTFDISPLLMA